MNNSIDPLAVLHGGELPVHPDAEFAARLRARLESAVEFFAAHPDRAEGIVMSGTDATLGELAEPAFDPPPLPRPAALPYLTVSAARDAIAWYVEAFGATVVGEPIVMDDGRIGHAELALGDGVLYLADEFPELGLSGPRPQSVSVSLLLPVSDTDVALARAAERGARIQREPYEDYGARNASIIDPFGHRWMLTGPLSGAVVPIQHGDLGYVSVWTPDADRAAAFYRHVLGWSYDPRSHQVTNTKQHIGIYSIPGTHALFCCYAVDDLASAQQAILDGGGSVDEPVEFDFGTVLGATDPMGTAFAVFAPAPGQPRPELNSAGPGELSYLTYEVPDAAAFEAFYGRILGWTFGREVNNRQGEPVHPMAGVARGAQTMAAVPMWTVVDIDATVARVRAAGGTVLQEPSRQPYGVMAECTDDQGGRFYLGEF